jgi:hypothetical protein
MSLLNTPPVQTNAQVQATIHAHIMQHLQMKADILGLEQMPPEIRTEYDNISQQIGQANPVDAQQLEVQRNDLLAQFSAPILSQLVVEYTEKVSSPSDEDPLVTIRKQELALKGQELQQEKQQFLLDQQRRKEDSINQDNIDKQKIQTQEEIAEMKDDTARARLQQQKDLKIQDLINKYNK